MGSIEEEQRSKQLHELGALGSAYAEIQKLQAIISRVKALLDKDPTNNVTPAKLRAALNGED
jgi:hypothetical protein